MTPIEVLAMYTTGAAAAIGADHAEVRLATRAFFGVY